MHMPKNKEKLFLWGGFAAAILAVVVMAFVFGYLSKLENERAQRIANEKEIERLLNEDNSDGYDDRCKGNFTCKKCKRITGCVNCMHNCYNRWGNVDNEENKMARKGKRCHAECWVADYGKGLQVDFEIDMNRGK